MVWDSSGIKHLILVLLQLCILPFNIYCLNIYMKYIVQTMKYFITVVVRAYFLAYSPSTLSWVHTSAILTVYLGQKVSRFCYMLVRAKRV